MIQQPPQFTPRQTGAASKGLDTTFEVVLMYTPLLSDVFTVASGEILTWQDIERTRPVTPPRWWREDLERRGTIVNSLEWCKQKGHVLDGEASDWRISRVEYRPTGRVIASRSRREEFFSTMDVHADVWSDEE